MRLDQYLVVNNYMESRNKAQYEIKNGNVIINDIPITKSSYDVLDTDKIFIIDNTLKYVSKGGLKLERALEYYHISPKGLTCLDIGASTGGFTDCLLINGAKEVFSVDTGINQLHSKLLNDPRVHSYEKTNFLSMDLSILKNVKLVVIDVSFIKVETILEHLINNFHNVTVISLIKPQFELGKVQLKNGVVKDKKMHEKVISNIKLFLDYRNIKYEDIIESPILGGSGNKEFLIKFYIK